MNKELRNTPQNAATRAINLPGCDIAKISPYPTVVMVINMFHMQEVICIK